MLIDTHAHIYLEQFDDDREAILDRAREAGGEAIVQPAIDVPSIRQAVDLCEAHDGLYAMAALHPSETDEATDDDFEAVKEWCGNEHVVAVGESGLDYYWDRSFDDRQQAFFRRHIRLAVEVDLPLVIHNREATEDILTILEEERAAADEPEKMRGILHCYVDPPEVAQRAWDLGFYVGAASGRSERTGVRPGRRAATRRDQRPAGARGGGDYDAECAGDLRDWVEREKSGNGPGL